MADSPYIFDAHAHSFITAGDGRRERDGAHSRHVIGLADNNIFLDGRYRTLTNRPSNSSLAVAQHNGQASFRIGKDGSRSVSQIDRDKRQSRVDKARHRANSSRFKVSKIRDLGSILRALYNNASQRKTDARMHAAIDSIDAATVEISRKTTLADVVDAMTKDRTK